MTDDEQHQLQERERADRQELDRARAIAEIMTSDPERQRVITFMILVGDRRPLVTA